MINKQTMNGMENTDVKDFVKKSKPEVKETPKTPEEVPAEKKPAEAPPVVLKVE